MQAKAGVELRELSVPLWWAANIADGIHRRITGRELVVTSTTEGKHRARRSLHYRGDFPGMGRAMDLRRWYVDELGPDGAEDFALELERELGADYDVILEDTHIHVEWQPTYREM